jgi:ATP-dependent Clp protease, protease subunit
MPNKFWKFKNLSSTEAELVLYGEIADSRPWWDFDKEENYVVPAEFNQAMQALNGKSKITVRLNSSGGDPFAATAIYSMLRENPAHKDVIIEGIAASAATIIACAGDTVKAPGNSYFMIHDPAVYPDGDSLTEDDLNKLSNALQAIKAGIINAYVQKSNKTAEELAQMMSQSTWMTGEQAKEAGFVDEILFEQADIKASADRKFIFSNQIKMDVGAFNAIPNIQIMKKESEDEKNMEEIKNSADLQKTYPDFIRELTDSAVQTALASERERLKDIDAISANISPELVNEAKYEKPVSAADLALQALKNDSKLAASYLGKAQEDTENSGSGEVGTSVGEPAPATGKAKAKAVSAFARAALRFDRSARNEEE